MAVDLNQEYSEVSEVSNRSHLSTYLGSLIGTPIAMLIPYCNETTVIEIKLY